MATTKSSKSRLTVGEFTWRRFWITASVALNIAVLVLGIAMVSTNAIDGMFIKEGLSRFCNPNNDEKFSDSTPETVAVRDFTCAHGNAKPYYENGLKSYLQDYRIPHNTLPGEEEAGE